MRNHRLEYFFFFFGRLFWVLLSPLASNYTWPAQFSRLASQSRWLLVVCVWNSRNLKSSTAPFQRGISIYQEICKNSDLHRVTGEMLGPTKLTGNFLKHKTVLRTCFLVPIDIASKAESHCTLSMREISLHIPCEQKVQLQAFVPPRASCSGMASMRTTPKELPSKENFVSERSFPENL